MKRSLRKLLPLWYASRGKAPVLIEYRQHYKFGTWTDQVFRDGEWVADDGTQTRPENRDVYHDWRRALRDEMGVAGLSVHELPDGHPERFRPGAKLGAHEKNLGGGNAL